MNGLVPPRYPTTGSKPRRIQPLNKDAMNMAPSYTPSASPSTSGDSLVSPSIPCPLAIDALDAPSPSSSLLHGETPGKATLEAALDALEDRDRVPGGKLLAAVSSCTLIRSSSTCDSFASVPKSPSLEWPRRTTRSPANRLSDDKMRAAYVPRHGPPSVFRLGWLDKPTRRDLRPGQALVRISAAGVNAVDCKLRSGALGRLLPMPFPAVLGTDFAGTVVSVMPERGAASTIVNGDTVYGQAELGSGFGAYAEWAIVSLQRIAKMPESLSFTQAAALPTISLSAHAALTSYAHMRPGDRVLVFGGTSGVGHAALQLAIALGAGEVSSTCSARNASFCEKLGASRTFDYHEWTPEQIVKSANPDVVLDTSGSPSHWSAVQAHAPGARFVVVSGSECLGTLAFSAGVGYLDVLDGMARAAGRKAISRIRKGVYDLVMPSALEMPLDIITPFVDRGQLMPSIFKEFSLREVSKAHDLRENKRPRGKVVINIAEGSVF